MVLVGSLGFLPTLLLGDLLHLWPSLQAFTRGYKGAMLFGNP